MNEIWDDDGRDFFAKINQRAFYEDGIWKSPRRDSGRGTSLGERTCTQECVNLQPVLWTEAELALLPDFAVTGAGSQLLEGEDAQCLSCLQSLGVRHRGCTWLLRYLPLNAIGLWGSQAGVCTAQAHAGADCAGAAPCRLATSHNSGLAGARWRRLALFARTEEPLPGWISLQVKAIGLLHRYPGGWRGPGQDLGKEKVPRVQEHPGQLREDLGRAPGSLPCARRIRLRSQ